MVTNLKTLIIQQLRSVFPDVKKVYDEPVRQGLVTPAFLLLIFDTTQQRLLASNVSRTYSINVNYFPSTSGIRNECDEVLETFQNEFRYIGGKHHVHSLNGVVEDDVLVITFTVTMLLREVTTGTKMNKLGGVTIV